MCLETCASMRNEREFSEGKEPIKDLICFFFIFHRFYEKFFFCSFFFLFALLLFSRATSYDRKKEGAPP